VYMIESTRILLISGSIRQPSFTRTLLNLVEVALIEQKVNTALWDLHSEPLPIADPAFHHGPSNHPDERVRRFVALADSCDAFVFSSPIYHNSYSGVLKNALDHLTIPHLYFKPVGLISHGGNRSTQAVDHLRIVVRGLLGIATPRQVCTAPEDYRAIDEETYELVSENIQARIQQFVLELIILAYQLRVARELLSQTTGS
jgi:azobenzene reductase